MLKSSVEDRKVVQGAAVGVGEMIRARISRGKVSVNSEAQIETVVG